MLLTIAIDGPVGAGKSSVADGVAKALNLLHLDTGAMYRAFAWYAMREGVQLDDEAALCALTQKALPEVRYENGCQRTLIAGTDVTELIRTPEVSMAASTVSKAAGVRAAMVERQQALAAKQSMLLDGRDIGTRVLVNAPVKIYLTASPETRAKRRFMEMQQKGETCVYEDVLADVIRRDEQDTTRAVDPLRPAEDAQILDTSDMTQERVIADIVRRVRLWQGVMPKREDKFTGMYTAAWYFSAFLFRVLMPIKCHHMENAQLDAPYILIANHNCLLDPLAVAWRCYRYQIRFLGKKELTKSAFARWMFRNMLMIPVDRHNMDMSAIRECMKVLKGGHPLGIFPEGTRYKKGTMEDMESGVAMIALMSKAPLVPVYLSGKPRLFRPIHVYYGAPIAVKALAEKGVNKEACDQLMQTITDTYKTMMAVHQQTVTK